MQQPTTYGYARVSTREQNLDRQLDALTEAGAPHANVLADKASGKDFDRPAWTRLTKRLKAGDILVVKSIDRLGRADVTRSLRRESPKSHAILSDTKFSAENLKQQDA